MHPTILLFCKVEVKVAHFHFSLQPHVHGILQARILEWVAVPFSRGSSQFKDQAQVSHIAGRLFTWGVTREVQEYWATREVQEYCSVRSIYSPGDLPDPGIEPGSPALQADSLSAELSRYRLKKKKSKHTKTKRNDPILKGLFL